MQGFPLSPQQRRLWSLLSAHSRAFRSQCAIELPDGTSVAAVRAALGRLVARHEILRTGFRSVTGLYLPVQVIDPEPRYDLEVERWEARAGGGGPGAPPRGPGAGRAAPRARPGGGVVEPAGRRKPSSRSD